MRVKRFLVWLWPFDKWDIIVIPYILFAICYFRDLSIGYKILFIVTGAVILRYGCIWIITKKKTKKDKKTKKGDEGIMCLGMCSLDKESAIGMHEEKRAEGFTVTFDLRKGA